MVFFQDIARGHCPRSTPLPPVQLVRSTPPPCAPRVRKPPPVPPPNVCLMPPPPPGGVGGKAKQQAGGRQPPHFFSQGGDQHRPKQNNEVYTCTEFFSGGPMGPQRDARCGNASPPGAALSRE